MTQPNLIETIEKALERFDSAEGGEEISRASHAISLNADEWLRALLEENERLRFGASPLEPLIKLQMELQQTREENKRLNESIEHWSHCYSKLSESKQRLMKQIQNGEEVHFATLDGSDNQKLREQLEQVKAERDKWKAESEAGWASFWKKYDALESIRTELSAKDKVLEWYAEVMPHSGSITTKALYDKGEKARNILSQYEVTK